MYTVSHDLMTNTRLLTESQSLRSLMVSEAFLRFFLETTGSFNEFMIHIPGKGRQFQVIYPSQVAISSATLLANDLIRSHAIDILR